MQKYFDVIEDQAGNVLAGWTVQVNLQGTATPASIFSDNAFTVKANPFTNSNDGTFLFYAANGRYDITFTKANSGFSIPTRADVLLDDPFGVITPTAISSSVNDYAPTNGIQADIWRISSTNVFNITGIVAPLAYQGARRLMLTNIGTANITLTNQDANSAAANRFLLAGGSTVLGQDASITLFYDQTTQRWRKQS